MLLHESTTATANINNVIVYCHETIKTIIATRTERADMATAV